MDIYEKRKEISQITGKGMAFILSAMVIWIVITLIYVSETDTATKNFIVFFAGGAMMPLSIMFSRLLGLKWNTKFHPLGSLGLILNFAQLMYFPLVFLAFARDPERFIVFYSVVTLAHLFPYGWLYLSKTYYVLSPVAAVAVTVAGEIASESHLWTVPAITAVALLFINISLFAQKYYPLPGLDKKKTSAREEAV